MYISLPLCVDVCVFFIFDTNFELQVFYSFFTLHICDNFMEGTRSSRSNITEKERWREWKSVTNPKSGKRLWSNKSNCCCAFRSFSMS